MKKTLLTLLTLLALAGFALAELPIPAVQYDRDIPGLDLTFTFEGFWPPVGAASWRINLEHEGIGATYSVPSTDRQVFVRLSEPLRPGSYFIQAFIVDGEGVVMDSTPLFSWVLVPPAYVGDLPRVAVGGAEAWETGVSLSCHGTDQVVTVTWELYDEAGNLVETQAVDIQPHASPAFNFGPYVRAWFNAHPEADIFTGSARFTAPDPVTMVYLCRPQAVGGDGIGFALVQVLRQIN